VGRLIDALLRRATRAGMRRGLAGEHWAWFLIAGAAYLIRRARRPDEHTEQIDVLAGERYLVTLQPRVSRRDGAGGSGAPTDQQPAESADAHPASG
jgi:hypothetical protein